MSEHPVVPHDQSLVDDVAARLDLRVPNAEALQKLAECFDAAQGEAFEAVFDMATAVGKTYLAAATVEYLAASGVRNILVVTPGRTILNKTVANFTEGHEKSVLGGMTSAPLVITAENFNTGSVAAAIHDDDLVKLFVFNVQQLIRPTDKVSRRTRKHQEWLGTDLYAHLKEADDLVILADECHVYTEKAEVFSRAVRDLDAMAVIGLTATPSEADLEHRVYHYPLARAIAERYVKTPVLVGRRDDAADVETRLRDGLSLLATKQAAADSYAASTGQRRVNAVMFVVADSIDNANAVAEVLSKRDLLGDDYEQAVLVVHSDAPDDALARLEAVEDPDSPVRVIVSVSMLKEGWDVKNIFVICSLRPSISDVLTEQTLGRGLRLPWGRYTDVELLDTVEVLTHERYRQLLAKAGVLMEGLVDDRAGKAPEPARAGLPAGSRGDLGDGSPAGLPDGTGTGTEEPSVDDAHEDSEHAAGGASEAEVPSPSPEPGRPTIAPLEDRLDHAQKHAAAAQAVEPTRTVPIPRVEVEITARTFNHSSVDEKEFRELGQRLADAGSAHLERKVLEVIEHEGGYKVVPREASDVVAAAAPQLPFGGAKQALIEHIFNLDLVPSSKASRNAAERLASAAVDGAGGEQMLASYFNAAKDGAYRIIRRAYRAIPEERKQRVVAGEFGPTLFTDKPDEPNRFGKFSRQVAYTGWKRSQYPKVWFDSGTERDFANLLDDAGTVEVWTRLQRGDVPILWNGGRYNPDFYALIDGVHYLLEVKADRDFDREEVRAKAAAAAEWARFVTDVGEYGTWRYLVVPQSAVDTGRTLTAVLNLAAHH